MYSINFYKLWDNLFKGLNFTGGQSSNFSHRKLNITIITVLRYLHGSAAQL